MTQAVVTGVFLAIGNRSKFVPSGLIEGDPPARVRRFRAQRTRFAAFFHRFTA